MDIAEIQNNLELLKPGFSGDIFTDHKMRVLYATDASAYRELPTAVTLPRNTEDIVSLINFARENNCSLIPRTAGTSLAGQVVGNGIVVDVSKYMGRILELNEKEHWVRVEPGVVLDELNKYLAPRGLFFGPETSTSSRCMMGGMVGNNSCGAHSLIYGSTREHTISIKTILSDGSEAEFAPLSKVEFQKKCELKNLEGEIYRYTQNLLSQVEVQEEIRKQYPEPSVKRRNTGYALDLLMESSSFADTLEPFNFSKLLAGSEGTLAFTTEIKLNLVSLPPKNKILVCVHLNSVIEACKANLIALDHKPVSVELMDKAVMDLTKANKALAKNRFFVMGDPGAILIVEFAEDDKIKIYDKAKAMEEAMRKAGYGFHFPLVEGSDIPKVWDLRRAGLGVLSNMSGDAKPVPVTEDTAVNPLVLPDYIKEFDRVLEKYSLSCVYYAHIATGELHLRPVLNLKDEKDTELFRTIAFESAKLVKKYKGSLSGEHGDGRLRGEFIPLMLGDKIYQHFKDLKNTWDPQHIFNPNKIVDTPPMNSSLRFSPGQKTSEIETVFDFSNVGGILRAAEKCNGSGDCRKSEIIGGTMCPSYMATRDENNVTRARANILREFLTQSDKKNPFDHQEIYEIMDLCLSCKACKSECPSNVDVTKLKAEFLQHYYDSNGIPLRSRLIAYLPRLNKLATVFPQISNFIMNRAWLKNMLGFEKSREFPLLYKTTLSKWERRNKENHETKNGKVYLFNDEFTNFNDTAIGIKNILLLSKLGYEVIIPKHLESGRTFLSKGLLRTAKKIARKNVLMLKDIISDETPLVGIEPSAILSFRDEYPELVGNDLRNAAEKLSENTFMIDEFLVREIEKGKISREQFSSEEKKIKLHGHCQQKAVASTEATKKLLSFPENHSVEEIPSGCCGMAGAFGYEKEHFEVSKKIGELVLFPAVRETPAETIIVAPGTSCRHQIKDGTQRKALHPVEVLYGALK
ncbi:MAG: FAD-linked oxidase C-terminal domain-containing protein [Bacteroidota bacterium]|nr:FAD-linked oxidase C-terminal domain-containing protein [Bacteroidota bacterium]